MTRRVSDSISPFGRRVVRSGAGIGAVAICNELSATIERASPGTSSSE
jgi:hypothetical protein